MKKYESLRFGLERALYNESDIEIIDCKFDGEEDGESALKEASNVLMNNVYMNLRYPLWHCDKLELNNVYQTENCRAALWYSNDIKIKDSKLHGIKALRECSDIILKRVNIISKEFGWKSRNIRVDECFFEGEYAFFESKDVDINNLDFKGKYSFQYIKNLKIINSKLNTKDAFWHSENIVVEDSIIEGEYLAWYSKNLTLIRCHIIGTQPFCYCENLKLIDCTMEKTDLCFENSEVNGNILSHVDSIKNVRKGEIKVSSLGELIIEDCKYKVEGKVIIE